MGPVINVQNFFHPSSAPLIAGVNLSDSPDGFGISYSPFSANSSGKFYE
jgi:hypothetical protein